MTTARAGWAEIETTPPLGLPMGGRGPRFTPGRAVLDPLIAQATVLEDSGGNRTLWISVDLVGLSPVIAEPLRYDLSALTGIPIEAVILNYSHTHSGPMGGFEGYATPLPKPTELHAYDESLCRNIIHVALAAVENLQPVTVTEYRGASKVGINRRRKGPSGETGMGPDPDGAHNPDLWLIDVSALDGGDRCVVFSYGCHPVIVYGYAWDGISADFPGVCRNTLRSELGANVHCQFIQGLAGNVRPRVLADLIRGRFRKSTPADPVTAGTELAGDVVRSLRSAGTRLDLDIAAAQGRFLAPRDQKKNTPRGPLAIAVYFGRRTQPESWRLLGRAARERYSTGEGGTLARRSDTPCRGAPDRLDRGRGPCRMAWPRESMAERPGPDRVGLLPGRTRLSSNGRTSARRRVRSRPRQHVHHHRSGSLRRRTQRVGPADLSVAGPSTPGLTLLQPVLSLSKGSGRTGE